VKAVRTVLSALAVAFVLTPAADAHEAFPAKLRLAEIERGTYEVAFTLPLIEGRTLRAEPLLPPSCEDIKPRETGLSPGGVTTTWSVRCSPPSLAGEAILIGGLLGTQTDLMAQVITLDGRVHTAILKPSRPGFIVPSAPSPIALAGDAAVSGMRRTLRHTELWVLLLIVVTLGFGPRRLVAALAAATAGHAGGQWLAQQNWLLMSPHLPTAIALLAAAVPALVLARRETTNRGWARPLPLWPAAGMLGILYGGAHPEGVAPEGLSSIEQSAAAVVFTGGAFLGLLLMTLAMSELLTVVRWLTARRSATGDRLVGSIAGTIACGLLVYRASALLFAPTGLTRVVLELVLVGVVLGPTLGVASRNRTTPILLFTTLLAGGLIPGLAGIGLPHATLLCYGAVAAVGAAVAVGWPLSPRWALPIAGLGSLAAAWHTGRTLADDVSLPIATAMGAALVAVTTAAVSLHINHPSSSGSGHPIPRMLGAIAALLAVAWRISEYHHWFDRQVVTEAALGLVRLPLLSLALVALAVMLWPRRRRALLEIGIETRRTNVHWALLLIAFFTVPVATVTARNPLYEPHAPTGDDARRVLARVLDNTYRAFNLTDEDALYDQLADNVTAELVADVYLDSRRRLTAGTRQGAEVTVRDVSVLEVGDAVSGGDAEAGFSYDCRWVVTSRVRHLQHVHHRQNIYGGVLTIRIDDDRWKIAWVELTSEDRVILPWTRA
jgi:hypothetical protein